MQIIFRPGPIFTSPSAVWLYGAGARKGAEVDGGASVIAWDEGEDMILELPRKRKSLRISKTDQYIFSI